MFCGHIVIKIWKSLRERCWTVQALWRLFQSKYNMWKYSACEMLSVADEVPSKWAVWGLLHRSLPVSPLFSPLHFTSPWFLCLLSFSFLYPSVFFLVSLCCGLGASQAGSNVSQAHHIFMCSCLFLSPALPFLNILRVSLPLSLSLPVLDPSLSLFFL